MCHLFLEVFISFYPAPDSLDNNKQAFLKAGKKSESLNIEDSNIITVKIVITFLSIYY